MKKLIVYYSFSGNTKKYAEQLAKDTGADLCEVTELKKRSKLGAFIPGIIQTMGCKKSKINKINADFNLYGGIIIASPVWASRQPPAVNSIVDLLPEKKAVEVIFISSSGQSDSTSIAEMIKNKKCEVISVKDVQMK